MFPPNDSDTDNLLMPDPSQTPYNFTTYNSCCSTCARAIEYTANLSMSTAFSNRFLHEISQRDPAMDELSNVLEQLATSQHVLAGKLIKHIISHGWRYKHQDPKLPSWRGEPSELVLNSNRGLVENLKNLLKKLKDHHHNTERNLIKGNLKKESLPVLWDQLDRLLVAEGSKLAIISSNAFNSINTSHEQSIEIATEETETLPDKVEDEYISESSKEEDKIGILADIKEEQGYDDLIREVFQDQKIERGSSSSENTNISEESESESEVSNEQDNVSKNVNENGVQNEMTEEDQEGTILDMKEQEINNDKNENLIQNKKIGEKEHSERKDQIKDATKEAEVPDYENTVGIKKEEDGVNKHSTTMELRPTVRKKIVFLLFECASWSSCGNDLLALILRLVNWLNQQDVMVLVPRDYLQRKELSEHKEFKKLTAYAGDPDELASVVDLVVCLGGDGTMLHANKIFQNQMPPVMGFGVGRKNALYSMLWDEQESKQMILKFLTGKQKMSTMSRARLQVTILNPGEEPVFATVLNEVTVLRGLCPCVAMLDMMLGKEKFYHAEGDGVIVSTPTGSSAYSLSAGGPLISPNLSCILLTPVACLSIHPVILHPASSLVITISPACRTDSLPVEVDGRTAGQLGKSGRMEVTMTKNFFPQVMDRDLNTYWVEMIESKIN